MANDSLTFLQVLPTYNNFIAGDTPTETLAAMKLSNQQEWTNEVYRVLKRRYCHWEIAYENECDFINALWERIEVFAPNYFERKRRYDQLLTLSDDELYNIGSNITNFVDNTNERYEDPFEAPLKNITSQTSSKDKGDIVSRLRSQIYNAQFQILNDFLDKFKYLFIRATSASDYYG